MPYVEKFTNFANDILASPISDSDTTITLNDASEFPTDNFHAVIQPGSSSLREIVWCTSRTGNVLTVQRGQLGTSGVAHGSGVQIVNTPLAHQQEAYNDHVMDNKNHGRPFIQELRGWYAALSGSSVGTNPAKVAFIGDSITEYPYYYLNRLETMFKTKFAGGTASDGISRTSFTQTPTPFHHVDAQSLSPDWDVIDGVLDNNYGPGGYAYELAAATSDYAETTVTCDKITLFYTVQQAGGCDIDISIDGGLPTTISTTDAGVTGAESGRTWSTGDLGWGDHKIRVTASGTGTAIIDGAYFHQEDSVSGVQIYNFGHNGWTYSAFNPSGHQGTWDTLENLTPDLIVVYLGTNDYPSGVSSFQTNVEAFFDEIDSRTPNSEVLIVAPHASQNRSTGTPPWSDFVQVLREKSGEHGYAFLDLYEAMGDVGVSYDTYDLSGDGTHPSGDGASLIATAIWNVIGEPVTGVYSTDDHPVWVRSGVAVLNSSQIIAKGGVSLYNSFDPADSPNASFFLGSFFTIPLLGMNPNRASSTANMNLYATTDHGGEFSLGNWDLTSLRPLKLADATETDQAITLGQANSAYVGVAGDTMTGQLLVDLGSNTHGIVIQGDAAQTNNLQEWQSSAGTVLSAVDEQGWISVGNSNPLSEIHVGNATAADPVITLEKDVTGTARIAFRTASQDYGYIELDASENLNIMGGSSVYLYDGPDVVGRYVIANSWNDSQKTAFVQMGQTNAIISGSVGTVMNRLGITAEGVHIRSAGHATLAPATGQLMVSTGTNARVVAVLQGSVGHTANLTEWQNSAGTNLVTVSADGDVEVHDATKGIILQSPDTTRWRITVDNTGALTTTSL